MGKSDRSVESPELTLPEQIRRDGGKPKKTSVVLGYREAITKALSAGYTLAVVWKTLRGAGVNVSYRHFCRVCEQHEMVPLGSEPAREAASGSGATLSASVR